MFYITNITNYHLDKYWIFLKFCWQPIKGFNTSKICEKIPSFHFNDLWFFCQFLLPLSINGPSIPPSTDISKCLHIHVWVIIIFFYVKIAILKWFVHYFSSYFHVKKIVLFLQFCWQTINMSFNWRENIIFWSQWLKKNFCDFSVNLCLPH